MNGSVKDIEIKMNLSKVINHQFIRNTFPNSNKNIKFAFVGDHINRYTKLMQTRKQKVSFKLLTPNYIHLIFIVEEQAIV